MKVLYIHQYFNTPKMSGGTRSYEMARRMVLAGHEVHIVTSSRISEKTSPPKWTTEEIDGINVHWYPVKYSNKMSFIRRFVGFLIYALVAGWKSLSIKADIIYATSTPLTVALPAVFASKIHRIPMVFEVRDLWPELPIAVGAIKNKTAIAVARRLERFAYFNSSHIVALSPGMKDGVVKTGYPSEKVSVIPNSSDNAFFGDAGDTTPEIIKDLIDGPIVFYGGTLGLINGVEYLADIASKMLDINSTVKFVVVGDGAKEEEINDKAKKLGVLNKNFFMFQRLSKKEMPAMLAKATIATSLFVDIPAMWHNSANKVFDAFAAGRPVMINHQGWLADLLTEASAGIVVSANNPQKAAEKLDQFLKDEDRLSAAGVSAKNLATEMFNRDLLAEKLIKILTEVNGNKGGAG